MTVVGAERDAGLLIEDLGDGLESLTLNRPGRLNAIHQPLADGLLAYFESRRRMEAVRVILIRGAGRAFSAGADMKSFNEPDGLKDGPDGDWVLRDVMWAMRACPQPLISVVQGPAAGGGFAIALSSDVIVAAESASFHPAFINIGLSGSEVGLSWWLQRAIGPYRAREILLTGRPVPASQAAEYGLVSALAPDGELDEVAERIGRSMLKAKPDGLRLTKRSCDATLGVQDLQVALELEERAQMLMIARLGRPSLERGQGRE